MVIMGIKAVISLLGVKFWCEISDFCDLLIGCQINVHNSWVVICIWEANVHVLSCEAKVGVPFSCALMMYIHNGIKRDWILWKLSDGCVILMIRRCTSFDNRVWMQVRFNHVYNFKSWGWAQVRFNHNLQIQSNLIMCYDSLNLDAKFKSDLIV